MDNTHLPRLILTKQTDGVRVYLLKTKQKAHRLVANISQNVSTAITRNKYFITNFYKMPTSPDSH